jgi:hypothetical protein
MPVIIICDIGQHTKPLYSGTGIGGPRVIVIHIHITVTQVYSVLNQKVIHEVILQECGSQYGCIYVGLILRDLGQVCRQAQEASVQN